MQAALLQELHRGLVERQLEHVVEVIWRHVGGLGGHGDGQRLVVAGTQKVATPVEPTIQLRPSGSALTGKAIYLLADAIVELNQCGGQGVELILQPGALSRALADAAVEFVKKRRYSTIAWIQSLVEIRWRRARYNIIELTCGGCGQRVSDMLDKPGLKKRAQCFTDHSSLKVHGILLALIEDQDGARRHEVPPLAGRVECSSAPHRLQAQTRAILLYVVVP